MVWWAYAGYPPYPGPATRQELCRRSASKKFSGPCDRIPIKWSGWLRTDLRDLIRRNHTAVDAYGPEGSRSVSRRGTPPHHCRARGYRKGSAKVISEGQSRRMESESTFAPTPRALGGASNGAGAPIGADPLREDGRFPFLLLSRCRPPHGGRLGHGSTFGPRSTAVWGCPPCELRRIRLARTRPGI